MGSSSSASDNSPSDGPDTGGARESEENKAESFDRSMSNAERPDRAPAAATTNDDRPDRAPATTNGSDNDNRAGGPEGGDTTAGYSGPNPDPRGPALSNGPTDQQDEDNKPTTTNGPPTNPGDLPVSDTTPNYTGPVNDPRGPALSGGEDKPTDMEVAIESRFGPMAPAMLAAGTFAAADGPSPIGDLIGLGIIGAAYYGLKNTPPLGPLLNENPEAEPTKPVTEPIESEKPSENISVGGKIQSQAGRRGWTEDDIKDVVDEPEATSKAKNKSSGNDATAYFDEDGDYVVVDDVTGDVVQVSDRNDPGWVPDDSIEDPHRPDEK